MKHIPYDGYSRGSVINGELFHVVNDHIESYSISK